MVLVWTKTGLEPVLEPVLVILEPVLVVLEPVLVVLEPVLVVSDVISGFQTSETGYNVRKPDITSGFQTLYIYITSENRI